MIFWKQVTVVHFICWVFALGVCYLRGCKNGDSHLNLNPETYKCITCRVLRNIATAIIDWFDEAQITLDKICTILFLWGYPEYFSGRVSFYWVPLFMTLCGQIRKSRQRTVQQPLPTPQLKFIFGKSYWPLHLPSAEQASSCLATAPSAKSSR